MSHPSHTATVDRQAESVDDSFDAESSDRNENGHSSGGVERSKQKASEAATSARQQAEAAKERIKADAQQAAEQARQKAQEAAAQAKQAGQEYADQKKSRVAEEIGVFSGAIRKASAKLHDEQHDSIACYVDAAAEQLDQVRDAIKSKDYGELLETGQQFARRNPEIVYGGMFLAGLAAMRFLKASKPSHTNSDGYSHQGNQGSRHVAMQRRPANPAYAGFRHEDTFATTPPAVPASGDVRPVGPGSTAVAGPDNRTSSQEGQL